MQTLGQKTQMNGRILQYSVCQRWGEKYFQFWQNAICESYLGLYLSEEDIFEKFALFRCTFCSPWGPPLDIALHPILFTLTSHLYLEYFPMQNILQPAIQDWLVQAALGISLKSFQAKESCTWYVEAKKKQTLIMSNVGRESELRAPHRHDSEQHPEPRGQGRVRGRLENDESVAGRAEALAFLGRRS